MVLFIDYYILALLQNMVVFRTMYNKTHNINAWFYAIYESPLKIHICDLFTKLNALQYK